MEICGLTPPGSYEPGLRVWGSRLQHKSGWSADGGLSYGLEWEDGGRMSRRPPPSGAGPVSRCERGSWEEGPTAACRSAENTSDPSRASVLSRRGSRAMWRGRCGCGRKSKAGPTSAAAPETALESDCRKYPAWRTLPREHTHSTIEELDFSYTGVIYGLRVTCDCLTADCLEWKSGIFGLTQPGVCFIKHQISQAYFS